MKQILDNYLNYFVAIFIDNILFSQDLSKHLKHLELTFKILAQTGLKYKVEKCELATKEKEFWAKFKFQYIMFPKRKIMKDLENKNELRSFLGLGLL